MPGQNRPPIWRRRWFLIAAAIVALLLVVGALSDPEEPSERAAKGGDALAAATPTPTPTTDPRDAARVRATELVADGRYLGAVTVLEAAGLDRAADRVARRGAQALLHRARRAFAAGRFTDARRLAANAGDVHPLKAARGVMASAGRKIAEARAAAALARDQRTCSGAEKVDIRAGAATPLGCDAFAAELAAKRAAEEAEEAASQCDPNYTGACLDPNSYDYDCAGGSGDGPDYTGTVRIVGGDPYDLDRDGDGIACDV
jgi:hypothetical protein